MHKIWKAAIVKKLRTINLLKSFLKGFIGYLIKTHPNREHMPSISVSITISSTNHFMLILVLLILVRFTYFAKNWKSWLVTNNIAIIRYIITPHSIMQSRQMQLSSWAASWSLFLRKVHEKLGHVLKHIIINSLPSEMQSWDHVLTSAQLIIA